MLPDIAKTLEGALGAGVGLAKLRQELEALRAEAQADGKIDKDEAALIREVEREIEAAESRLKAAIPEAEDFAESLSEAVPIPPDVLQSLIEAAEPLEDIPSDSGPLFSPDIFDTPDEEGGPVLRGPPPEDEAGGPPGDDDEDDDLGAEELEEVMQSLTRLEAEIEAAERQVAAI